MNNDDQLETVEVSLESAVKDVDALKALHRLRANKDFKLIIDEGYFKEEASRLVLLRGSTTQDSAENQVIINRQISGVGKLFDYFMLIQHNAMMAEKLIEDDEAERERLNQAEAS